MLFLALSLFLPHQVAAEDGNECQWFGEQTQERVRPSVELKLRRQVIRQLLRAPEGPKVQLASYVGSRMMLCTAWESYQVVHRFAP
jgi:hypothetical protein